MIMVEVDISMLASLGHPIYFGDLEILDLSEAIATFIVANVWTVLFLMAMLLSRVKGQFSFSWQCCVFLMSKSSLKVKE